MAKTRKNLVWKLRNVASQLPLDAKRKPTRKDGIESWYPYYAGFTESFARRVLQELGNWQQFCVMDPWNGSGTTTRLAHALGHIPLGFDINPVACLVASAKIAHPEDVRHVVGFARRIGTVEPFKHNAQDPLIPWLAPSVVAQYRGIEKALLSEMATTSAGQVANVLKGKLPPLASFLLLALIRTARDFATMRMGSNPTWVRPGNEPKRVIRNLGEKWAMRVAGMSEDLDRLNRKETLRPWCGHIRVADSKRLPVEDETVDLILTSPPYCTRIDYVVSTSFELSALGIGSPIPAYEELRRAAMGTPLARKGPPPDIPKDWPIRVSGLLQAIREHPSKASRSYYFKTFWQYFDDALVSLREFHRTLRPGASALLVLQTSYYKDLLVDLPQLYIDMAEHAGLSGSMVEETGVRRALAQINPHASRHKTNRDYREAVVSLEKLT